jgi:signal transduction histidine kinase
MSWTPDQMSTSPRQHPASFFWQGVFILLPVAALATIGLYALRQDRLLAEAEARQSAQRQADAMVHTLWARLVYRSSVAELPDFAFRLNEQLQLMVPPPAPVMPAPGPPAMEMIDPKILDTWNAAWAMADDTTTRARAMDAIEKLRARDLSARLAAPLQFRLGLLQAAEGQIAAAVGTFTEVENHFPTELTESGLPLQPLAGFKRLELLSRNAETAGARLNAGQVTAYCSNLVYAPTFLSPLLLNRLRELAETNGGTILVDPWEKEWIRHKKLRALATAALESIQEIQETGRRLPLTHQITRDDAGPDFPSPSSSPSFIPALFWFHTRNIDPPPAELAPSAAPGSPTLADGASGGPAGSRPANAVVSSLLSATAPPGDAEPAATTKTTNDGSQSSAPLEWLASRFTDGAGGHWIVGRAIGPGTSSGVVRPEAPFLTVVSESLPPLPEWLGYSLEVAGRTIHSGEPSSGRAAPRLDSGGSGTGRSGNAAAPGVAPEILATSREMENGVELLRVQVLLLRPDLLFARQATRSRLFGLLIASSAAVAVLGFFLARRAFHRQEQLAGLKSNFVSSVSHELRAPIASVRLMAESLDRGTVQDPARQRDYFRFIVQECRRLGTLIENVLDFARIEQGRKQYDFEPTDIATLVTRTVQLMEPVAIAKQVTLVTQLPEPGPGPESPTASDQASKANAPSLIAPWLDGQAIQQALVNLIDNALKHSPPGATVTVTVAFAATNSAPAAGTKDTGPGASVLLLSVADGGPGIPREEHGRIFERFYRRGSELRRETQGVGIGLSIVKHIVEAHGGQIKVQSAAGQGSRFILELPVSGPARPNATA